MIIPTLYLYDETSLPVAFDGKQWSSVDNEQDVNADFHRLSSSRLHLIHPDELNAEEAEILFKAHFNDYQATLFDVHHEQVTERLHLTWACTKNKALNKEYPNHHIASTWLKGCLDSKDVNNTLHCMEIKDRLYVAHIRQHQLLFYQSYPCPSHSMVLYYIFQCIQELHLEPEITFFQCLTEVDLDNKVSQELQSRIATIFLGNSFEGLLHSMNHKTK